MKWEQEQQALKGSGGGGGGGSRRSYGGCYSSGGSSGSVDTSAARDVANSIVANTLGAAKKTVKATKSGTKSKKMNIKGDFWKINNRIYRQR